MVKLIDYLADRGITGFQGWLILSAVGITPDGKVIAGNGINPEGLTEGWIVTLP